MRVRFTQGSELPGLDVLTGYWGNRGWSTTILTSKGELFTAGSLESRGHGVGGSLQALKRLRFPLEYPNGKDRLPAAAIAQFSSGRSHILGLSDSGDVWFWDYKSAPGWKINFLHSDVPAAELTTNDTARVTRVVAGWDCSSAYVAGKGILVWKIPQARFSPRPVQNGAMKAIMAVEDGVVPSTHYQRPKRRARHASNEHEMLGKDVGEVTSHLALEGYIVFLTDLGKVFAARHATSTTLDQGIVELDGFEPSQGKAKMTQIEGSFRSFAVFNTDGDVVLGNCDQLDRAWKNLYERGSGGEILTVPQPIRPAALQNRGVISLAFGDWHQLALTAKGDVLSFGKEPQLCGCLGLGTYSGEGYLRGVRSGGHFGANDGDSGGRWRRIFFSPEQREWLRYMRRGGMDTETGRQELAETATNAQRHLQLADWFEEKGAEWDRHPNLETSAELGASTEPAYKVVSISAAGWHCGALVLADDEKIRRMYRAHAGFLPIPNGYEVSDLASRVWNSISALWKRTTETQQPEVPPTIDQYFGRDHRYYYSPKPWDVIRRNLPEEARHEVVFPVIEGASGEQEL